MAQTLEQKYGRAPTPPPKFTRRVEIGDTVLVKIDEGIRRPMIVTHVTLTTGLVSGTIFCEPDDHSRPVFRGALDTLTSLGRITGRPDRLLPLGFGDCLAQGSALGQWMPRPLNLPSGR